ncbi:MAG: oligopeptide/dipeptide ABC transporter ATP-binding protein [Acidimicrobiales bacterium]|jgi:oligopeptide/dipeptide ABC transporter ATP-binding protein
MAEALIEVDALSVRFRSEHGHTLRAVEDVTLQVAEGEVLGLVGESGCGKTTIAKCIAGRIAPTSGVVRFDGRELSVTRTTSDRRAIQMVFQDPYSSLNPRLSVRHVLSELLRVHGLVPRADVEARCRELVALVGLPPGALDGLPSQFSGGQRQRIAIARALTVEPRVIIADEPVSALDVSVQATILRLFEDLRSRLGLTVVFISHNLAVVRHLSDRVAVMYLGRIVEQGDREAVFSDPRHPYTRALLAAAPRLHQVELVRPMVKGEPPSPIDIPTGCAFHPRCPRSEELCTRARPCLEQVGACAEHAAACHFRDETSVGDQP